MSNNKTIYKNEIIIDNESNASLMRPCPGKCTSKQVTPVKGGIKVIFDQCHASISNNGLIFKIPMCVKDGDTLSFSIVLENVVHDECKAAYDLSNLYKDNSPKGSVFYINPETGTAVPFSTKRTWTCTAGYGYTTFSMSGTVNKNMDICDVFVSFDIPQTSVSMLYGIDAREHDQNTPNRCVDLSVRYIISLCSRTEHINVKI